MAYGHPLGWVGLLEIYPMSFRKQSFVVWQESQQVLHVETIIMSSVCSKVFLDYPLISYESPLNGVYDYTFEWILSLFKLISEQMHAHISFGKLLKCETSQLTGFSRANTRIK